MSAALVSLAAINACSNNPFNPHAELRVLDVASSVVGRFVGIRQSASVENGRTVLVYTYSEPVVKLQSLPGYPAVNFSGVRSRVTLADGTVLPEKSFPLTKGALTGAEISVQIPIMGADRDLQNVVFPGNGAPRVRDGQADVHLSGTDLNGNAVDIPFTVPLSFESLVFSDSPNPPSVPTPSPQTSPTPGGQ